MSRTIVFTIGVFLMAGASQAAVWYVDGSATGAGTGDSWGDAFTDIQAGITAASGDGGGEVWVAGGTYTSTSDPVVTLASRVDVYGGFAGSESLRDDRDWESYVATIDGENARRCVMGDDDATLDGFTVTQGSVAGYGGGMNNTSVSPTVANCLFEMNFATGGLGRGAAMYNHNASPEITNCTFYNNASSGGGGGIYSYGGAPVIVSCTFKNNEGEDTMYTGGGLYFSESPGTVINCTFYQNSAFCGGGIGTYKSGIEVTNCSFTDNNATFEMGGGGGMFFNGDPAPVLTNCIVFGNQSEQIVTSDTTPTVNYSLVEGGYTGTGNLGGSGENPLFMDYAGNMRLQSTSPCINVGDDSAVTVAYDRDGNTRIVGTVDMGAFEFQAALVETNPATDVTTDSAVLHANVTTDAGDPVTERGFYHSALSTISPIDLSGATKVTVTPDPGGIGAYEYALTGLSPGQERYFLAYVTNGGGTAYGARKGFSTKVAPVITWSDPASIEYGTALSGTQLNATANVPGTFVYDPPVGTVLSVGTHPLEVTFTPDDTVTYGEITDSVNIEVTKQTPSVTAWPTASAITYGQALSASVLSGGSASTAGSFAFDTPAATPGAGTYPAPVTFTPSDTANYNTVGGSVGVTVNKAAATVTLSDLVHTYDGTPKSATVTTDPPGLSVTVTYDGAPAAPTEVGDYAVLATVADADYAGSAAGTLQITAMPVEVVQQSATVGGDLCLEVSNPGTAGAGDFSWTFTPAGGVEELIPDEDGPVLCLYSLQESDSGIYTATYDNGSKTLMQTVFEVTVEAQVPAAGMIGLVLLTSALGGLGALARRKQ